MNHLIRRRRQIALAEWDDRLKANSEWPDEHTIGVYLSVGSGTELVATCRRRSDLAPLFRHLADEWDRMASAQPAERTGNDWFFGPEQPFT